MRDAALAGGEREHRAPSGAVAAALELARRRPRLGEYGYGGSARFSRTVAIGDLQASARRVFEVLAQHELLADDGRLRPEVQLLSIGDHFDYGTRASGVVPQARCDGQQVLSYLAAHDPAQVVILAGNHDLARVTELAAATDERFAEAAPLAEALVAQRHHEPEAFRRRLVEEYAASFPELPAPGLIHRDYSAFGEEQRALVQELLIAARMALSAIARLPTGEPVLATHAAVTTRELAMLDVEAEPAALSEALAYRLRAAVAEVAAAWQRGQVAALSLTPLHIPGATALDGYPDLPEGGGMFYHRPADPERAGADRSWESAPGRPRRFHPRTLPAGLLQIAGHTGHPKCVEELARWSEPGLEEVPCGRRSLRVRGESVGYQLGAARPEAGEAVLYLIDPSMHRAASAATVEIFELMPGSLR